MRAVRSSHGLALEIVARTAVVYLFLLFGLRLLGRGEVATRKAGVPSIEKVTLAILETDGSVSVIGS